LRSDPREALDLFIQLLCREAHRFITQG
jgi:hypothetical protein